MTLFPLVMLSAALGAGPCAPASAERCSCLPLPPPGEALAQADAVFAGTVVSVETRGGDGGMGTHEVRLVPTRRWKGAAGDTVVVRTPDNSAACGVAFSPGEAYLVYASGGEDGLRVSLCSRTRPLAGADDEVAALGEPGRTRIPVRKDGR